MLSFRLETKLACTGTVILLAWVSALYLFFLPMELPGLPKFLSAGVLEWMVFLFAVGASVFSFRLLYLAWRYRGVAWWAYAIGFLPSTITLLVALLLGVSFVCE